MGRIRFPVRVGTKSPKFIVLGFIAAVAWSGPSKLFASPQASGRPAQASVSGQASLNWESQARLRHRLKATSGTLILSQEGVVFRPTKGSPLHWPFLEIQTFDLLTSQRLVITGYENRSWHRHGEQKYHFDLGTAMPPDVAAELARRAVKPARNGNPNPTETAFAMIPARHRTLAGGTSGTLRFGPDGIDYLTPDSKGGRAWRWSDIQTLANPDPFHLRVDGYRETFTFELKQPMSRELFDRLWGEIEARDLNRLNANGPNKD
jgi:hypothetical protein